MWKYTGPYKIIEKISDVVYRLELPPTLHVHPVFHISRLKRFHTRPAELQPPSQAEEVPPPPVIVDDHEEYEVENILAKRRFGRVVKYLVKWRGYPIEASTWQSVDDLANAADIVRQFEARRQRSIEDDCKACSRGYRKNKIIEEEIRPKIAEDTGNIAGRKISGIQKGYRQEEIAVEEREHG
jgi:hypothetical protein